MEDLFWNPVDISRLPSLSNKSSAIIVGTGQDRKDIILRTNNSNALYINDSQQLFINTNNSRGKINIGNASNHIVCYHNNDNTKYSSISVDESGSLHLDSVGDIHLKKTVYLGNEILEATASELNYNNGITPGIASPFKTVILDSNKSIEGITSLSSTNLNVSNTLTATSISCDSLAFTTPINSTSGGTGHNQYAKGDLLVGSDSNSLSKIPVSASYGSMLVADQSNASGLSWDYQYVTRTYTLLSRVRTNSRTSYKIGPFIAMNAERTKLFDIPAFSVSLNTIGINGIATSDNLQGLVSPGYTTTINGSGTLFLNEIPSLFSVIRIGNEFRKVIAIISNTIIQVDEPFTLLNNWTLGETGSLSAANPRFGLGAFNGSNAATSHTTVLVGSPNRNHVENNKPWTLDVWFRYTTGPTALNRVPICSSLIPFTLRVEVSTVNGNDRLIISIGEGIGNSFSIATDRLLAGNLATGIYYHLAVVYSASRYVLYVNGVESLIMNTGRALHPACFNSFRFGSDGTNAFGGNIDEVRLSKVVRYTEAFSPITSAFVNDSSTIFLNHFDSLSSVNESDETTLIPWTYGLDGGICKNTVYYGYALASDNISGYVFSSVFAQPPLSVGFTYRRIPFYITSDNSSGFYVSRYVGNRSSSGGMSFIQLMTPIPIISNATNASPTILNTLLHPFVPQNTTSIVILVTHNHATPTLSGVVIGHHSANLTTTILSTATVSTIQIQYTLPINQLSLDTFFDVGTANSSYSVSICGYYTE